MRIHDAAPPVDLLVLGAHLSGQPLNHQLVGRGATLVGPVQTAPTYRLWALDTVPAKPGLLRVSCGGSSIRGERWRLTTTAFGHLVATLPAPLSIGTVELVDGTGVPGFLVEAVATERARDITAFGGWLAYLDDSKGGSTPSRGRLVGRSLP